MGLELVYERLALERITAENAGETVVEGTVALPERAGEIGRALKLDATPVLSEIQVKEDKVVFEGALDLTLLYVSFHERRGARRVRDDPDGEELDEQDWSQEEEPAVEEVLETVAWRQELPFVYLLDLAGVQEGDDVETAVEVRSTAFEVRSDRVSVDVDVVLAFSARAAVSHEISVAKGVRGESSVEVERRSVRVASLLGRGKGTAEARGELSFGGRPAPERLLEVRRGARRHRGSGRGGPGARARARQLCDPVRGRRRSSPPPPVDPRRDLRTGGGNPRKRPRRGMPRRHPQRGKPRAGSSTAMANRSSACGHR